MSSWRVRGGGSLGFGTESMNVFGAQASTLFTRVCNAPLSVKKKVFEAAFSSATLYGCKAWLKVSLKSFETPYMPGVKALLGETTSTPILTCLLSVQASVRDKQAEFHRKVKHQLDTHDDLLGYDLKLTRQKNLVLSSHLVQVMETSDHISTAGGEKGHQQRINCPSAAYK